MNPIHFITGTPKAKPVHRLDDETYAQVLDSKVIQCIDILPSRANGDILLGYRTHEPQPDWWVFGGAMPVGFSPHEGATKNFDRETTVHIEPSRFTQVGWYSLLWDKRAQAPQDHGCHMSTTLFTAQLSENEIAELQPGSEYSQTKWVSPQSVIDDENYHPALRQMVSDFLKIS
jgi:ADP-ribose pyrophosphatase YjhB (NUDIX family)